MNCPVFTRRAAGIALVAVLVFVVMASAGVLALVERAAVGVMVEARARRQARLGREASAALEAARAMIDEAARELGGLHHPAEGWGRLARPEALDSVVVTVGDASARVSLAMLDKATAKRLFMDMGESTFSAEAAAADWAAHLEANRSRAGRLADDWEHLWRLPGFAACVGTDDRERTERRAHAREMLALESFDRCNIHTVGTEALRLLGLEARVVDRMRARVARQQTDGAMAEPSGTEGEWNRLAVIAQAVIIEVEARVPGLDTCRLRALLRPEYGKPGAPDGMAGRNGAERQRLSAVVEEIRRRRALRQGVGAGRGVVARIAAAPTRGGTDGVNYQLIDTEESFTETPP